MKFLIMTAHKYHSQLFVSERLSFTDFTSPPLPYTHATTEGRLLFVESVFVNPKKTWQASFFIEETY